MGVCCCTEQKRATCQKYFEYNTPSMSYKNKEELLLLKKHFQILCIEKLLEQKVIKIDIMKSQMLQRRIKSKPALKLTFCYHFIDKKDLHDVSAMDILSSSQSTNNSSFSYLKIE